MLTEISDERELAKLASNYITSDLAGYYAKSGTQEYEKFTPGEFAKLVRMIGDGTLSSRGAKEVLTAMAESGGDPAVLMEEKGLAQVSDPEAIRPAIQQVLAEHASVKADYLAGKEAAFKFLVGQVMRATRGAANPELLQQVLTEELGK